MVCTNILNNILFQNVHEKLILSEFEIHRLECVYFWCIFQFLSLDNEDERQQLIPVLTTMLKLSPDEKQLLLTVARGGDQSETKDTASKSWGAYLHRWSGMS